MITQVDYLEGERLGDIRHEYLAGQVYAMAGTSKVHNLILIGFPLKLGSLSN
jgi:hypothetical protein